MSEQLGASPGIQFGLLESLYRGSICSVTDPGDYFKSQEYRDLSSEASRVFVRLHPQCQAFLDIVRGQAMNLQVDPEIQRAFCFSARFLKGPSADLPIDLYLVLDRILGEAFYMGLLSHLFLTKVPTRTVEGVDYDKLTEDWMPRALVADRLLKRYSADLDNLPPRVFESYYRAHVRAFLRKQLGVGFWNTGRCHSYFRNLFFSGTYLGLQYDLHTDSSRQK